MNVLKTANTGEPESLSSRCGKLVKASFSTQIMMVAVRVVNPFQTG